MNKIGKAMLCTVLTGAMAVGAAGAADLGSLSPQGAKAYLNQITTLQNKYAARTDDGFKGLLTGLSMAKLVDMDGDGTPELYCGAGLNGQHMYSYADGKIYALDIPEGVSNFGTDVSPCTQFYVGKAKAYLVSGQEVMNNNPVTFWTKQGDKAVVVSPLPHRNFLPLSSTSPAIWTSKITPSGKALTTATVRCLRVRLCRTPSPPCVNSPTRPHMFPATR